MVTDYIVAIYLGTSHLVGMVGKKNSRGALSIVAEEVKESSGCIRRGRIHNVAETAARIKRLVLELQNKLPSLRIEKVYIGIGGQSLRSIDHSEVRTIRPDAFVTEDDIRLLNEQCKSYRPEMSDVLAIAPPVYYLDDKRTANPVGVSCRRIEARYKLVVGQPIIRNSIINSVEQQAGITVAGIIVSPLALAEAILTRNEKELGCAVIDFGAGVTSIVVYKNGHLAYLNVIPLGSDLITRDLTSLRLVETEAERLKITYGNAKPNENQEGSISLDSIDGIGTRKINLSEIDMVVEARTKEIVENVYVRMEENKLTHALGAGVVLVGGGAALKNLQELVRETFKLQEVRYSTIRKGLMEEVGERIADPRYMSAISLLLQGTESCTGPIRRKQEEPAPTPIQQSIETVKEPEPAPEVRHEEEEKKSRRSQRRGSIFGGFGKIARGLFDEE